MKTEYKQLLKPEIVNSVSGLSLIARVIVDGYLHGQNHSRRVGAGMEFSQYRGYEPGDDLRRLDWKVLARSGRYYIKQSEIETNIAVKFIVDASKSMLHKEDGISKSEYVKVVIASLAHLCQNQGDAVGLFALNNQNVRSVFPKMQKQHFNRFLLELINIKNEGKWPDNPGIIENIHNRGEKELIILISDMYESSTEITNLIKSLKTSRNEIVLFQITGKREMDFDYKGTVTFEDLETGQRIKIDAEKAKQDYLNAFKEKINTVKDDLLANDISYQLFRMDENIGQLLQIFLKNRNRLV
ncbi:DUF58 domain-containing protein [Christiangramia forsetii]|uniref:DUF58 domain-containing protein n=2 Tax=Christiangramia forsetii TaxID=411153 RepID=A0M2Q7_CHRFK|nr:DUF58 domain-containing protein [Christiangramia forsetii]GGG44332.1 hypothetical protein GCM10011532_30420 [Christiangramia forsetii]CAL66902.1 conserved hypothetical protein [Christiangramia forsetii KT0803]